ncbi:MAG: ribonuclease J [Candidatus Improbicoccus pseudotrichonymphae]|uniref:Ribonuclease J n=1 Tax=Candidatus Improbicoccus pseudotrichonymphae TaxID=3033792 RepID=A0AA48I4H1_9FIRM|nr:MAG: ribonuclease J [Candidatus Improbicoccus pseudotrichonymphae]
MNKPEKEKTFKLVKSNINSLNKSYRYRISDKKISKKLESVKISFLGGLNQIGKNITIFETENDILIVDCGMAFPDGEMLGIDLVIPDFTYLVTNKSKVRGLVITHGHEDHIGAIPYLVKKINIPIYGTKLTIGLISSKLREHKLLRTSKLCTVAAGDNVKLGSFNIEFIHTNHSIPDAVSLALKTPAGTIIHTGDFKIDLTPSKNKPIDLAKFAKLGEEGVLALLSDSTNAERPGYTNTEKSIDKSFYQLFFQAKNKRIIVASFASNLGRIQQVIECAKSFNRKVAFSGRSMVNNVEIAIKLGYIIVPEGLIIDIDEISKYSYEKLVIITTGSQGEPMSALHRMAFSEHRKISIGKNDFIIISATPIPGNEKMVISLVNEMMKLGCEVIYESMYEVHVSGHACQEELKIIQALVKPKFFIPVHGEYKNLKRHAKIARDMGMPEENIYVGETGDVVELNEQRISKVGVIPSALVMIDGIGVGDVGSVVLKDRKHLGQDGLIIMVVTLDFKNKEIISGPDIISRGFVYVKESEVLMNEARKMIMKSIVDCFSQKDAEWTLIKTKVRDDIYKFFYDKTKRNPLILPIIMGAKHQPIKV